MGPGLLGKVALGVDGSKNRRHRLSEDSKELISATVDNVAVLASNRSTQEKAVLRQYLPILHSHSTKKLGRLFDVGTEEGDPTRLQALRYVANSKSHYRAHMFEQPRVLSQRGVENDGHARPALAIQHADRSVRAQSVNFKGLPVPIDIGGSVLGPKSDLELWVTQPSRQHSLQLFSHGGAQRQIRSKSADRRSLQAEPQESEEQADRNQCFARYCCRESEGGRHMRPQQRRADLAPGSNQNCNNAAEQHRRQNSTGWP